MATASKLWVTWKSDATPAAVPLDCLPFAAALVDESAAIVATNRAWKAEKCEESNGFQAIRPRIRAFLNGRDELLSQESETAGRRYRTIVTRNGRGALVMQQPLEPLLRPQAEKLETVGRLVGGVAHDFANLLTLIIGYSEVLLSRAGEKDPSRMALDEIRKAADRGSRLTAQLLGFTRARSAQPKPLDLNVVVGDLRRMLKPIIGEHIELDAKLAPALPKVLADPGQIDQVIMNLILNARDAMPAGGRILIETSACEFSEEAARLHEMEASRAVMLSITDNGQGIQKEILQHLFEPFFTTKAEGKGTGLGLCTVRQLVKENGGDVWVSSVPGQGTTFTVCLPGARPGPEVLESPAMATEGPAGSETVLLVEDEDNVRKLLSEVLRSKGYQVLEASNGEAAVPIFHEHRSEIALVITDMMMPRMGGRELAAHLREVQPEIQVIFMSGYTDDVLLRSGAVGPGMSFLQKPLRPDTLADKVREALDSAARPFNPR